MYDSIAHRLILNLMIVLVLEDIHGMTTFTDPLQCEDVKEALDFAKRFSSVTTFAAFDLLYAEYIDTTQDEESFVPNFYEIAVKQLAEEPKDV